MNSTEGADARKAAAIELIDRGFHVLAVKPGEKRSDPLLSPHGFSDATTNPEVVSGWLDAKPKANLGVRCGKDTGILVVDVDVKNGAEGLKTIKDLWLEGFLTLTADTPSGGYHLYFKHPGVALKSKLPGIDFKGADGSGYVLAPPSMLPTGGYRWRDPEIPIAPFPEELVQELLASAPAATTKLSASGPAESIKVKAGGRHNKLVELGAVFRGMGLQPDDIEALLWAHAERDFAPPFSKKRLEDVREIEAVARWYAGKAPSAESLSPITPISTIELRRLAKITPTKPLLDPPLPEAGSLMIYGTAGVGKSHIGLCVAGALALGKPFLDWTVESPVKVLYVDGEMPLDELDTRISSYFGDDPLDNLVWLAARAQEADLPNLADSGAQEIYAAAIQIAGATVVVFDNLSCLRSTSADLPENSVEAWLPIGAFIRHLNRVGIAVIIVHHASKSGQQRGSTAHVAPMDTVICLQSVAEGQADPIAENDIEIVFEKHRRFGGEAAATFRAKAIGDPNGNVRWQRTGPDPLMDDVVRMRNAGMSVRAIARATRRSKAGIQKAIERAKGHGLLPLTTEGEG